MIPTTEFIKLEDDFLFKEAFTNSKNRDALIDLIATFTDLDKNYLKSIKSRLTVQSEVQFENTKYHDRRFRGDIVVAFDNIIINIECYSTFKEESFLKSECYLMRLFSSLYAPGEKFNFGKRAYQINLVDQVIGGLENDLESSYCITNEKKFDDKKLTAVLDCRYHRIDRAREIPYNEADRKIRWLRFIGAKSQIERDNIAKGDEIMTDLNQWIQKYVNDKDTIEYFHKWDMKLAKDEGIGIGREQGIDIGREQGIDIGREQGIDIGREGVAQELIKKGMSDKDVSEVTSVPLKKVKALKDVVIK